MAGEWRKTTLREAVTFFAGGDSFLKLEYTSTGVPVLAKGDVKPFGRVVHGGERFMPEPVVAERGYRLTTPGDFLLTTRDLTQDADFLGLLAPIPLEKQFLVNQGANIVRFCPEFDGRYLVYWCNGPTYRAYIKGHYVGSTQIHLRKDDFLDAPLLAPPLAEQKAIAAVLGALDDRIELNRRMNATLEAMVRALFQSWFVDFDPVRAKLDGRQPIGLDPATAALFPARFEHAEDGLLPLGWRRAAIDEVCGINARTLGKNEELEMLEYVEISEVSRGNIENIAIYKRGEEPSRARRRLRHGDTILSTVRPDRGSYFLALNPPENRVASTGFAVLTPTKVPWSFLHAAMTQPEVSDHLGQMADGGAYPAVRPEVIGATQVVLPNEPKILEAFHSICALLFEQAEANRTQSRILATLRDTLLPKLLNGDFRIPI